MKFMPIFTQGHSDAYDLIHFSGADAGDDGFESALARPENWGHGSAELLAEAAQTAIPDTIKPVEENTVPSWLWRKSRAKIVGKNESSAGDIFDRVAGSAAYQGWKQKLFADENSARVFYDEARYALAQRFIALEPKNLAVMGLEWAYGISAPHQSEIKPATASVGISNGMIDSIVSGRRDRALSGTWQKIVGARLAASAQQIRFADTEAQWQPPAKDNFAVCLNLMAFRHNDGFVNIEALRHATRLALLLADLQGGKDSTLALGFANLAPLLMALALPYDSDAGRATAAAISGIITAEAYIISAELAVMRGPSKEFIANRDLVLRSLRNHRRAAYGEQNDYEKISITPSPLALTSSPDLTLIAAARSAWDQALGAAQKHGLQHVQVTSLAASPALTLFMESDADGIVPMRSLTTAPSETAQRAAHPSVGEALLRLGYDAKKTQAIIRHITGALTLDKAPAINHAALRALGFTSEVLANVEAYLPRVQHIRYAFTPWVLGIEFCRKALKIPAAKLDDMRFNLLAHLGFSVSDIAAANGWCYGHDNVQSVAALNAKHAGVFATAPSLPAEAQIRMAAAVQAFLSGETGLAVTLPVGTAAERFEKLLLDAWRGGVKSATVHFDAALAPEKTKTPQQLAQRKKISPSAFAHAKAPTMPKRGSRSGAPRLGGMSQAKAKSRGSSKAH